MYSKKSTKTTKSRMHSLLSCILICSIMTMFIVSNVQLAKAEDLTQTQDTAQEQNGTETVIDENTQEQSDTQEKAVMERLYGRSRYDTCVEVSKKFFTEPSEYAVVVSGEGFADALCAGPLANQYNAPVYLVHGKSLETGVINELNRLQVKKVFIAGGTGAVSQEIETYLENKMNLDTYRFNGRDRYETSLKIADKFTGQSIFAVTGNDYPDAVSAAAISAVRQQPIILFKSKGDYTDLKNYIKEKSINKSYIIGGEGVVPSTAESILPGAERIYGRDRYMTNLNVIKYFMNELNMENMFFVYDNNYADEVTCSCAAGKLKAPLILSSDYRGLDVLKYLNSLKLNTKNAYVLGGPTLISDKIINRYLNDDEFLTINDYLNKYKSARDINAYEAFVTAKEGLDNYVLDAKLKNLYNTASLNLLKLAVKEHNNSNFETAKKYYALLNNKNIPRYVYEAAKVYNLMALNNKKIVKKYSYEASYAQAADSNMVNFKKLNFTYTDRVDYDTYQGYLDMDETRNFSNAYLVDGIPKVNYGGNYYYNPVTVCNYALYCYTRYIKGKENSKRFINSADYLLKVMDNDGSLRYQFPFFYHYTLNTGWVSSMAQGEALSVMARAYHLTKNIKYINAGKKFFQCLIKPTSQGGTMDNLSGLDPALKSNIYFEEYATPYPIYTLNGYMYTMLGIYDWYKVNYDINDNAYSLNVKNYFDRGIESLKIVLPYHDLGGFTTYDLYYVIHGGEPYPASKYHGIHVEQLNAIYAITKDEYFKKISDLWNSYMK